MEAYKEKQLLFGCINVHIGKKERRNEIIGMLSWIGIDLCVVTETWFREGSGDRLMSESLENSEYEWYGRDRRVQKSWSGDGGVGVIVRKGIGEVSIMKVSKKFDMLWLKIKRGEGDLYVAAAYCCVDGSMRMSDSRAQFLELEEDIFQFQQQGSVICLGDFNSRIGTSDSILWKGEEKVVLHRKTQDLKIEGKAKERGIQFVEMMNACEMVILNGVDNQGEYTFHSHNKGSSVVDYIIVSSDIFYPEGKFGQYIKGSMRVWNEEFARVSDHCLITCQVNVKRSKRYELCEEGEKDGEIMEKKESKEELGWKRKDHGDRKFWEKLEKANDTIMDDWITKLEKEQLIDSDPEALLESYKEHLNRALRIGVGRYRANKKRGGKKFVFHREVLEATLQETKAYREWKTANEEDTENKRQSHRLAKKNMKRVIRKHRRKIMRKQVKVIENIRSKDPKEYWRRLRALEGIKKKSNQLPKKALDEDGDLVVDPERVREVWAKCFEKLGKDNNENKNLFDEKFAQEVEKEVRQRQNNQSGNLCLLLDSPIDQEEVARAIKKLRRGKAVGMDKYMNEIFMYGGEKLEEATWKLMEKIFNSEQYPHEWAKGIIFPLFKGGTKEHTYDPSKYRGITLLSVLGKIYVSVLNERVTAWVEGNEILVEEQAGFRKDRNCADQLFIITEMIKNRRPMKTQCCFIDIQKAYDRIWREGLWYKLQKYGMSGKMWRILQNIYASVESCVLVNEQRSRFFEVDVGLRQGCLMSPILFAIYINGLAEEIRKAKVGAQIVLHREDKVGILMFADDIALLAHDREELQALMDLTYQYSLKWRFTLNYDKCAVVVFDNLKEPVYQYGDCIDQCTCGNHWRLGNKLINQQGSYKYLGIELDQNLSWSESKERILSKARKCMSAMWGMGMAEGNLSVKATINLYEALVRSLLEYGAEIWGARQWEEAEVLQREMGRRILRCPSTTTGEAILGELGWWRLMTRRDYIRLKYWIKLSLLEDKRLVRQIYKASKYEYLKTGSRNWCSDIHYTLLKYGLSDLWKNEDLIRHPQNLDPENQTYPELREFWEEALAERIQQVEEEEWKKAMGKKPKLRTYQTIKSKLRVEAYLLSEKDPLGRYWVTRIRSGTNPLRIESGRRKRPVEPVGERICRECKLGEIEDEKHFILKCSKYDDYREELFQKLSLNSQNSTLEQQWQVVMGEREKASEVYLSTLKMYVRKSMNRRNPED
jgi:hypothetical protein